MFLSQFDDQSGSAVVIAWSIPMRNAVSNVSIFDSGAITILEWQYSAEGNSLF